MVGAVVGMLQLLLLLLLLLVLAFEVIHEGVPLALHVRLVQVGESLQALGGADRVAVLRRVHQPHIGEASSAVPQRPVLSWIFQIICRDHVTATTLGIWRTRMGRKDEGKGRVEGKK